MKKLLILALFVVVNFIPLQSHAANVTMRLGWSTPDAHIYGDFARLFKEKVEAYSNGTIDVKLFHSGQLGSEDAAFKAMQLGTIDGYFVSSNLLSVHYPLMDIFSLPYVFESVDHMVKALKTDIAKDFFADFTKKTKVHLVSYGVIDVRDLYNTVRDINNFQDFAGIKYRVPKTPVMIETFKAFGAEPIPLAWSETPSALQTGTVEGGDNGTSVILQMKFYELSKHLTVLDHFTAFSALLAGDRFMAKLDEQQRAAVARAALETNEVIDKIAIEGIEKTRAELAARGMKVTRPDRAPFIAAAKKVQVDFAASKGKEFQEALTKITSIKP